MHMVGAAGMPRRVLDYPQAFAGWNLVSSIGAFLGAFAFVWGLGTILYTIFAGKRILENNYWGEGATTLGVEVARWSGVVEVARWSGRCGGR